MPYTGIYRSAYLLGISAVSGTPGNLQTAQTIPTSTFISGFTNTSSITGIVVSGNSYTTTGNIILSAPTASNIDIYGSVSLTNVSIVTTVYNQVTGTGTITNLSSLSTLSSSNTVTGTIYTGNTVSNTVVSTGNVYSNTFYGNVQAGTLQVLTNTYVTSNTTFSNLTANLVVFDVISTGNVSGTLYGNLILSGNVVAQTILGSVSVTNVWSSANVAGSMTGNLFAYANSIFGSSIVTASNIYGNYTGSLITTLLDVGTNITATSFIGTNVYVTNSNTSLFPTATTITSTNVQANNTYSNVIGYVSASTVSAKIVTANLISTPYMFLGANNATTTALNTSNIFGTLYAGSGISAAPNIATTYLTGNMIGSYILTTPNLFTTTLTASSKFSGDNVQSLNFYSSSISAGNVFAYQNVSSASYVYGRFTGNISTSTSLYFSANLTSNVYGPLITPNTVVTTILTASNLSTTNITSGGNLVAGTLISSNLYGNFTGGFVNTSTFTTNIYSIITSLYTASVSGSNITGNVIGNVYMYSNSFSPNNLSVGNVYSNITAFNIFTRYLVYDYDPIKQGYALSPSDANSSTITTSLSYFYNNRPWWTQSGTPTVSYFPIQGQTGYSDVVVLPDNRLVLVPDTASNIVIVNLATSYVSNIVPNNIPLSPSGGGWKAGVLLPDSNVFFIPGSNAYGGIYDPYNNFLTLTPQLSSNADPFRGGVVLPSGNVLCIPYNSNTFVEINPITSNIYRVASPGKYFSGSLTSNGSVVCAPVSGNAAVYNFTVSNIVTNNLQSNGSVLLPTGSVLFVPGDATQNIGQVSNTGTYSVSSPPSSNYGILPYLTGTASVTTTAPTGNTAVSIPSGFYASSTVNFGSIYQTQANYSTSNIFIEMWIYPNTTSGVVFSFGTSSTYNFTCNCGNPNLNMTVRNTDGTLSGIGGGGITVTNTWQHFAFSLTISGANYILRTWLNGVPATPATVTGKTPLWFASDSMYIGGSYPFTNVDGYYRDVRVISGSTIPSGSFTPATVPFGTGLPSYVTGGTTVFSLFSQYLTPLWILRSATFQNGCLLATGQVLFGPGNNSNVLGIYDPQTSSFSNVYIQPGYGGIRALPDGRAVLAPSTSTNGLAIVDTFASVPDAIVKGPYYNHF